MRNTFAKVITDMARKDERVVLLVGDIGNRLFDEFKSYSPERFFNCGIAEANMLSVACGLALSGFRPYVYTIAPFTTIRCLEQIKVGIGYHELPVTVIGTGAGLSYSELGPTHHSLEDLAILRSIPNINILAPSDPHELEIYLRQTLELKHGSYIRLGKKGEPLLYKKDDDLGIGKACILNHGSDLVIVSTGPILSETLKARDILVSKGFNPAVVSFGTVAPLDSSVLKTLSSRYPNWIIVEEHYLRGGLGTAILEWISENNLTNISITKLACQNEFSHKLGKQEYMRAVMSINAPGIAETCASLLNQNNKLP